MWAVPLTAISTCFNPVSLMPGKSSQPSAGGVLCHNPNLAPHPMTRLIAGIKQYHSNNGSVRQRMDHYCNMLPTAFKRPGLSDAAAMCRGSGRYCVEDAASSTQVQPN
ncbi:hypothetical protein SK128_018609 [Halocaridina rubra]|uniref:Uncharacterized protein n=1 Tax=Halocaridina rubra TaxID=373956 RepID=A0AAN8XFB6_HALRR